MRRSRRLVLDPSVLIAASESEDPRATACRTLLLDMLRICHHVVITREIEYEWKERPKQRGKWPPSYSRRWLVEMHGRKKVDRLQNTRDDLLRGKIAALGLSERDQLIIREDIHLVEAAIAADKIVCSLDEEVLKRLHQAAGRVGELRLVVWMNPVLRVEELAEWLEDGAPLKREWRLGYQEDR